MSISARLPKADQYVGFSLSKILVGSAVCLFVFTCITLRSYAPPVPNTDFFAYMSQADELFGSMQTTIQYPPAYTLVLSLGRLWPSISQKELVWGRILDILLFVYSVYFLFRYLSLLEPDIAIPVCLLILSNYLSFSLIWQVNNISLFFFLVSFVLWADSRKYEKLSIVASGVGFLVRSEAILLWIILLIKNWSTYRPRTLKDKLFRMLFLFLSAIPILVWELVLYKHALVENWYVMEVHQRIKEIPNWQFLYTAWVNSVFPLYFDWNLRAQLQIPLLSFVVGLVVISVVMVCKNKLKSWYVLFLFSLTYLIVHIIFPENAERYSYPLLVFNYVVVYLPIFYLVSEGLINQTIKKALLVLVTLLLITLNISEFFPRVSETKYFRYENILLTDFLKNNSFTQGDVFVTLEQQIVRYYLPLTMNALIVSPKSCMSVGCIRNKYAWAKNIYIVIDNYNITHSYFIDMDSGALFRDFYETHKFEKPMISKTEHDAWIKIYRI